MSGILMMVIAIVVLGGAYLLYGRYLQNKWGIDPNAKTPAYEMEDGVDYVPADTNVVFGHQFASIAGAGPINGHNSIRGFPSGNHSNTTGNLSKPSLRSLPSSCLAY